MAAILISLRISGSNPAPRSDERAPSGAHGCLRTEVIRGWDHATPRGPEAVRQRPARPHIAGASGAHQCSARRTLLPRSHCSCGTRPRQLACELAGGGELKGGRPALPTHAGPFHLLSIGGTLGQSPTQSLQRSLHYLHAALRPRWRLSMRHLGCGDVSRLLRLSQALAATLSLHTSSLGQSLTSTTISAPRTTQRQ